MTVQRTKCIWAVTFKKETDSQVIGYGLNSYQPRTRGPEVTLNGAAV